jgi:hypothetical protein
MSSILRREVRGFLSSLRIEPTSERLITIEGDAAWPLARRFFLSLPGEILLCFAPRAAKPFCRLAHQTISRRDSHL